MNSSTNRFVLVAVATAGLLACAGPERMQPQTPGTTTTTSGTAPELEGSREGASGAGAAGMPAPVSTATDVPQGAPVSEMGVGTDGTPAVAPHTALAVAANDAQFVGAIRAASRSILGQAREAVKKGRSARVRQLAGQLLETYGRAETELDAVASRDTITPAESSTSEDFRQHGEELTLRLRASLGGSSFDRSYVEGQVDELEKLLELIDTASAQARSEALRSFLGELRPRIAESQRFAADVQVAVTR